MSSLALLLLGILACPALLRAQASEEVLAHRVAMLTERYLAVQRAVARRDSEAVAHQDLVLLGAAPLRFAVPRWVAPAVAEPIAAIVDSWAVRTGPLFAKLPPETVTIPFYTDTAGSSREARAVLVENFPLEVMSRAEAASAARIQRLLGGRFVAWEGKAVPLFPFDRGRRDAVLALAADTTRVGRRCLDGEAAACTLALGSGSERMMRARRSFLAGVLEDAGPAGWAALAADTLASPESRIAAAGGASYQDLVARWIGRLRSPPATARGELASMVLVALGWGAALLIIFLWRLTWHRG